MERSDNENSEEEEHSQLPAKRRSSKADKILTSQLTTKSTKEKGSKKTEKSSSKGLS